jgi:peptide chain release factor 1
MLVDKSYLDKLAARVAELESQLADPATAANQKKFKALISEHANLKAVIGKADAYFKLLRTRDDSRALLQAADTDPELREMAQAEIDAMEKELPAPKRNC